MKIIVLGSDGMLGHKMVQVLQKSGHDVFGANRSAGFDVRLRPQTIRGLITGFRPDVVVNCSGLIKQRGSTVADMISVNALAPHRIYAYCTSLEARLIHVSTDCVFSGGSGLRAGYREEDVPDPVDSYGRTKLLGEVNGPRCVTLRTSLIGLELTRRLGLVEWFLSQPSPVRGYSNALFSGVTTVEFSHIVARLIEEPSISGIFHVAAESISKLDLLEAIGKRLTPKIEVFDDPSVVCNRSLDGSKLASLCPKLVPTSWETMLDELAEEINARGERK